MAVFANRRIALDHAVRTDRGILADPYAKINRGIIGVYNGNPPFNLVNY